MSSKVEIFKQASWLGFFNLIKQLISWLITIIVARILVPGDYGLMEMATVFTGYVAVFSEMGIGAALIQKKELSKYDISSVFWFSLFISLVFAVICYFLSYPTAYFFNDTRVLPITKLVSVCFIINGIKVVPINLLKKNMQFKKIGFIEATSTIISCLSMYVMASNGAGVWTLIWGTIVNHFSSLIFYLYFSKWLPILHFNFKEAVPLLRFGIFAALTQSFFYVSEKMDRFFAGRAWNANILGYYSFALQIAQIPTDRIVSLINQVSYPAFSEFQSNKNEFNRLYLDISKITLSIVAPVFIGGFLIGEELIRLLLDEKWFPMIMVFRYLCLVQIVTSLNSVNNFVFMAQGKPQLGMVFNIMKMVLMSIAFFIAVPYGLNAILIPWLTVYVLLCIGWINFTIKRIDISLIRYIKNISHPFMGSLIMVVCILIYIKLNVLLPSIFYKSLLIDIISKILIGAIAYFLYLIFFDTELIRKLKKIKNHK